MNDDVYERFEISDWDLNNEFNTNRHRKQSKESAIYGKCSLVITKVWSLKKYL